jgi:hypothetical protein
MGTTIEQFLELLTSDKRAVLIGGLAVIAHGLSRGTKDADIWLEPMEEAEDWLLTIENAIQKYPLPLTVHCLPGWKELTGKELINNIELTGMVRITGLPMPLDIFRKPNGYEQGSFDSVWENASAHYAGIRLPRASDLLPTKEDTGRQRDFTDWVYLVALSRTEQSEALANARSAAEASRVLDEYFDYEICKRGLKNTRQEVRDIILAELQQLADDGDPFAKEILAEQETEDL